MEYKHVMQNFGGSNGIQGRLDFDKAVSDMLKDGWKCQGSVCLTYAEHGIFVLTQAMVKQIKKK